METGEVNNIRMSISISGVQLLVVRRKLRSPTEGLIPKGQKVPDGQGKRTWKKSLQPTCLYLYRYRLS